MGGVLPAQDLGAEGARDLSGRVEKCDISGTVRLYGKFFVNLPGFKMPLGCPGKWVVKWLKIR